jgi:hypothetical protein
LKVPSFLKGKGLGVFGFYKKIKFWEAVEQAVMEAKQDKKKGDEGSQDKKKGGKGPQGKKKGGKGPQGK